MGFSNINHPFWGTPIYIHLWKSLSDLVALKLDWSSIESYIFLKNIIQIWVDSGLCSLGTVGHWYSRWHHVGKRTLSKLASSSNLVSSDQSSCAKLPHWWTRSKSTWCWMPMSKAFPARYPALPGCPSPHLAFESASLFPACRLASWNRVEPARTCWNLIHTKQWAKWRIVFVVKKCEK